LGLLAGIVLLHLLLHTLRLLGDGLWSKSAGKSRYQGVYGIPSAGLRRGASLQHSVLKSPPLLVLRDLIGHLELLA
jgi:hypothetical protein